MKKGKIVFITPKSWTNPEGQIKNFFDFGIDGDATTYTCWQTDFASKKVGDEIEFNAEQKGNNWRATLAGTAPKTSGGGYRPMSPEQIALEKLKLRQMIVTMSASYAKDIVVALLAKEPMSIGDIKTMQSDVAGGIYQFCIGHMKEI